jgi:hypothetical protein
MVDWDRGGGDDSGVLEYERNRTRKKPQVS